jgi:hypothetical protein
MLIKVALLLLLSVAGVAGQTKCCTGTANPSKGNFPAPGGKCTAPDGSYVWTEKTCDATTTCRSYKCTLTAVVVVDTLMYQDCLSDATYQTAMTGSSTAGYKCTSDATWIKSSMMGVWLAAAIVVSLIYSSHT